MFELSPTQRFSNEMKKLQKQEIERISKKLEAAAKEPMPYFSRLEGTALHKIRIGKFRVIASIDFPQKKITCLSVGLRKNIYRNLGKL